MLDYFPRHVPRAHTNSVVTRGLALIAVLSCLQLLDACEGISSPATTITPAGGLTVSSSLPSASVGASYNATITVSGGTSPYQFSLASGELPTGVALGSKAGTLTGTPSATGSFNFVVVVSDSKGLTKQQSMTIAVSTNPANSFPHLQASAGWAEAGQGPPNFVDCNPCGPQVTFSFEQDLTSPSMSGSATQFNIGGTGPYWDVLFNNHLIGDGSSQGMPDQNHTIVPSLHNFTYDVYFYGSNLELSQALEFDLNQFFNGLGFIWGHECRVAGGNEWDIWDNVNQHWVPTGIACHPNSDAWNHLTIQVQRTANNQLLYQSITLNGVTSAVDQYYNAGTAPGWYGVTVNYQMDGNSMQSPYTVYLDNLTFTYE
jgi:hypothetical protein